MSDNAGNDPQGCQVVPFPRVRLRITDSLGLQSRKHVIHALAEMDVSLPRQRIRRHRDRTGETLSFTAFVTACVARAVGEDGQMHACRKGTRRLVIFDEVDVATLIEHDVEGERVATPFIIRAANKKSFDEIHREFREAQERKAREFTAMPPHERLFFSLPAFVRVLLLWAVGKFPRLRKKYQGTVAITAVGMFGKGMRWLVPMTRYTLCVTLGGIWETPGVVEGRLETREHLGVTVSVDHDIVDGAPLAKFISRLKELVESGYGLAELSEPE